MSQSYKLQVCSNFVAFFGYCHRRLTSVWENQWCGCESNIIPLYSSLFMVFSQLWPIFNHQLVKILCSWLWLSVIWPSYDPISQWMVRWIQLMVSGAWRSLGFYPTGRHVTVPWGTERCLGRMNYDHMWPPILMFQFHLQEMQLYVSINHDQQPTMTSSTS